DLVFFTSSPGEDAHHVGIYAGDGKMVHAPTFGQVVQVAPLLTGEQIDFRRFG
ncbi:hypothetical protein GS531_03695, partial [Rhodococcus hoagii]|nr:hypothetical protein [Prescottella equi]